MDAAHRATDKELERIEKKLAEIYKQASKELGEKADKYFERFKELDQQKRALVKAGKMTEADYKRWRHGKLMTGEHWKRMQKQAAQRLTEADRIAAEYTNGRLPYVYALNYNSVAEGLETRLNGYSFELVDEATVRNLAESDKTLLPYKVVDGKKAERWHTARVNAEVTQGILQGESIPKIAKRLKTNVGMTAKGSAVRNARTSVTSAENKGRMDMLHDAREKGVIVDKIWIAAHDSRTREAHLDLDGQQVPEDESFESSLGKIEYPGDPDAAPANTYNCRCSLGYKVVGFEKMEQENITVSDGLFDEDTTRNVNEELSKMSADDARKWKKQIESSKYKIDPEDGAHYNKNDDTITINPNEEGWAIIHENAHRFDYTNQKDYIFRYTDRRGNQHEDNYGLTNPRWFINYKIDSEQDESDWRTLLKEIGLSTTPDGYLDTSKVFDEYNRWAKGVKKQFGMSDKNANGAFGALSDIISSITQDGCGESLLHGGHSKSYWSNTEMVYAENWADFCYLKSTDQKEMLDILRRIAPNRYNALEEVYNEFWTTMK